MRILKSTFHLAITDFSLRYQGSVLGFFWALLKPLLIFLTLDFVFSHIFGASIEHYSIQLLLGIVLWGFFAETSTTMLHSLVQKSYLITKIPISKTMILLAALLQNLFTLSIHLLIVSGFFLSAGLIPNIGSVIMFMGILLVMVGMTWIIGLIGSLLFVRFRDMAQIWEVLLNAGFYLCPIVFPLSIIPEHLRWLVFMNPMSIVVVSSKDVLIDGQFSFAVTESIVIVVAIIAVTILSTLWFKKQSRTIAEYL